VAETTFQNQWSKAQARTAKDLSPILISFLFWLFLSNHRKISSAFNEGGSLDQFSDRLEISPALNADLISLISFIDILS
jgi:hypothetical protein